jgi:hypothetical protein
MRMVPSIAALFLLAAVGMAPVATAADDLTEVVSYEIPTEELNSDGPTDKPSPCGVAPVKGMADIAGTTSVGLCSGPFFAPILDPIKGTYSGFCACTLPI